MSTDTAILNTDLFQDDTMQISPSLPSNPASKLQESTLAVKVAFTWFGNRKALSDDLKEAMTLGFGASAKSISASKRLFANHPALKALSKIKGKIRAYWQEQTLPFPEDGKRLLPKNRVSDFRYTMECFQDDLRRAVNELDYCLFDVKRATQEELGTLYNPDDYPDSFQGKFNVDWAFSDVSVPSYLMALDPAAYEQERLKVAAQFDAAIKQAEQEFIGQFEELVSHLCERLAPSPDGQAKIFRDSSVNNLLDFFDRFKALDTGSNDRLNALVQQAKDTLAGRSARSIRDNQTLKDSLNSKLSDVAAQLDTMLIDRPRRRIIREETPAEASE